jgi:hypothetical protein
MTQPLRIMLAGWLLLSSAGLCQDRPRPISLIQLIANPKKFDGKLVMVRGFLRLYQEKKHGVHAVLYVSQEDAKQLLPNSILVLPSDQMVREKEGIDRKYVILTGLFRVVRAAGEDLQTGGVIKEVQSCAVWSSPNRPIGEQENSENDPN